MVGRIQEIGDRLFQIFQDTLGSGNNQPGAKRTAKEWERLADTCLKRLYEAARVEHEKKNLGVLSRARVAFHLQKKMIAAGYPPLVVRQILFAMLLSAFVRKQSRT